MILPLNRHLGYLRDKEVLERVRNIKREDMEKHPNPDFKIKIVPDSGAIFVGDMVMRMKMSDDLIRPVLWLHLILHRWPTCR